MSGLGQVRLDGEGGDDAVYETDRFLGQSCGGKLQLLRANKDDGRGGLNFLRRFTNSVVGLGARTTAFLPMTCWREKDILLLPLLSLEPLLRRGLSRGCEQRFGLRGYVDQEVSDCVEFINWFAGLANSAADSEATRGALRVSRASVGWAMV